MTTRSEMFDTTLKGLVMAGKAPEVALRETCDKLGMKFAPEVEQNIIDRLRFAMNDTPKHAAMRRLLSARIRQFMREGCSTKDAVAKAQDATGIKLGEQGAHMLVQALDAERERIKDMRVEVISEDEFHASFGEKCMFFHLNGKDGWACCQCRQHNTKRDIGCTMCGHGRCDGR